MDLAILINSDRMTENKDNFFINTEFLITPAQKGFL